eukprot:2594005-Rhodomonas_salina.1
MMRWINTWREPVVSNSHASRSSLQDLTSSLRIAASDHRSKVCGSTDMGSSSCAMLVSYSICGAPHVSRNRSVHVSETQAVDVAGQKWTQMRRL